VTLPQSHSPYARMSRDVLPTAQHRPMIFVPPPWPREVVRRLRSRQVGRTSGPSCRRSRSRRACSCSPIRSRATFERFQAANGRASRLLAAAAEPCRDTACKDGPGPVVTRGCNRPTSSLPDWGSFVRVQRGERSEPRAPSWSRGEQTKAHLRGPLSGRVPDWTRIEGNRAWSRRGS
jgi:hypothetical protein